MSRKHNTKHRRSLSNYKQRLAERGLVKAPTMPSLRSLRKRAGLDRDDLPGSE